MSFPRHIILLFFVSGVLLSGRTPDTPKNIIILIGDGMGLNQVSASYLQTPYSPFRHFPITGLSVTCSADKLITDSAAGATALATGERTKNKYVGVDTLGAPLFNLMQRAEKRGKATGIVVTSTITNASPASFVAHHKERSKEREIALQYPDGDWDVMIGGGLKHFLPDSSSDTMKFGGNVRGVLVEKGYSFFHSYDSLRAAPPRDKFYALLARDGLPRATERNYSLADLFAAAMPVLQKNKNGFLMMIEGSQIDWACHDNDAPYFFGEMKDFSDAVEAALQFAKKDGKTLVVVTADHETGGLAINEGKRDGSSMKLGFTTKGHTAGFVGIFAYGPGAEEFSGILDIHQIGRKLHRFLGAK